MWANNHPVFWGSTFTVHNGTIRNDDELFRKHNWDRVAEVDSEIIPAVLDKYGFENAHKAFEELKGGFATASIDPIRYPGQVILAKGGTWPLVVHENKHFVVWASEYSAIKEAWSQVLGTPPSPLKCQNLNVGDILVLDGDKSPEKRTFKYADWSGSSHTTYQRTGTGYGQSWEQEDEWEDEGDYEGEWWWHARFVDGEARGNRKALTQGSGGIHTLDLEARVKQLRAQGRAVGISYAHKSDFPDWLSSPANTGQWSYCRHCKDMVAKSFCTEDHVDFGTICCDCLAIVEPAGHAEPLSEDTKKVLEKFADLHTYVHNQALYKLSRKYSLKRTTLDFLLFRSTQNFLESSDQVQDLYCVIADDYAEITQTIWDEIQAIEDEETPAPESKTQSAGSTSWVNCPNGVHPVSESGKCPGCLAMRDGHTDESFQGESCEVVHESLSAPSGLGDCMLDCKRKAKVQIGHYRWCRPHFNKCAEQGCKNTPVATVDRKHPQPTDDNGLRFCHEHSRGRKGLIGDRDSVARKHIRSLKSAIPAVGL